MLDEHEHVFQKYLGLSIQSDSKMLKNQLGHVPIVVNQVAPSGSTSRTDGLAIQARAHTQVCSGSIEGDRILDASEINRVTSETHVPRTSRTSVAVGRWCQISGIRPLFDCDCVWVCFGWWPGCEELCWPMLATLHSSGRTLTSISLSKTWIVQFIFLFELIYTTIEPREDNTLS